MVHHTGAILQRDGKTFAIVTRIPGGVVTPDTVRRLLPSPGTTRCRW